MVKIRNFWSLFYTKYPYKGVDVLVFQILINWKLFLFWSEPFWGESENATFLPIIVSSVPVEPM